MSLKKKILSISAAALAACAINVSAFAQLGYFGPTTLHRNSGAATTYELKKEDNEAAVVNVTSGLSGSYYVTFRVRCYGTNTEATSAKYIYVNGKQSLSYLTGKSSIGAYYYLKYELPTQSSSVTNTTVSGKWEP